MQVLFCSAGDQASCSSTEPRRSKHWGSQLLTISLNIQMLSPLFSEVPKLSGSLAILGSLNMKHVPWYRVGSQYSFPKETYKFSCFGFGSQCIFSSFLFPSLPLFLFTSLSSFLPKNSIFKWWKPFIGLFLADTSFCWMLSNLALSPPLPQSPCAVTTVLKADLGSHFYLLWSSGQLQCWQSYCPDGICSLNKPKNKKD